VQWQEFSQRGRRGNLPPPEPVGAVLSSPPGTAASSTPRTLLLCSLALLYFDNLGAWQGLFLHDLT